MPTRTCASRAPAPVAEIHSSPAALAAAQSESPTAAQAESKTSAQAENATAAWAPARLIPVPKWNDHHDWPPPGGMRHLIFNAETNGFASAFKRVGRRVLVDESEFYRCIERTNGQKVA